MNREQIDQHDIEDFRAGMRKLYAAALHLKIDAICDLALSALRSQPYGEPVAPDKRRCHAPGERCPGCPHYYGKADVCSYADAPPDGVVVPKDELHAVLSEIVTRIERCGASDALTHAVTLASDLRQAVGNQWNPADKYALQRVREALAAAPKGGE